MEELWREISLNLASACEEGTYRLFHGRGGAFSSWKHLNIDWFNGLVFTTLYQSEMGTMNPGFWEELTLLFQKERGEEFRTFAVQDRSERHRPSLSFFGPALTTHLAKEGDFNFELRLRNQQNLGLFVDSLPVRQEIFRRAHGKRVLNLFSYTCSNSVYALKGGAKSVLNIDVSKASLNWGRENHSLNGLEKENVEYLSWNILKSASGIARKGPFDLIVIDPPSNQPGGFVGGRDYPKVLRKCESWLSQGGEVIACLNSPLASPDLLNQWVEKETLGLREVCTILPPFSIRKAETLPRPYFKVFQLKSEMNFD